MIALLCGSVLGCGAGPSAPPRAARPPAAESGPPAPVAALAAEGSEAVRREPVVEMLSTLPIANVLYTYPTPAGPVRDWDPEPVALLGLDPPRERAVFFTQHIVAGAREGEARETIDVVELPGGRRRHRIRADYRVHVSGDDGDHLGRYRGSWARGVRQIADFIEAEGLRGHWRANELTLSPDRQLLIVSTLGRPGPEHGPYLATRRGRLLHPLEPSGFSTSMGLDPVFTPRGARVVYGCHRYEGARGTPPVAGLCLLEVASGEVRQRPVGSVDSGIFLDRDHMILVTSEAQGGSAEEALSGFHICLRPLDLRAEPTAGPAAPIRCWDDAWVGSRVIAPARDGSVVVFLRAMDERTAPPRVLRVRLRDGEVLEEVRPPQYTTGALLLPGLRLVITTGTGPVGFADLRAGRTRLWEPAEGAHLGSFMLLDVDGEPRLFAVSRPGPGQDSSLVELDLEALFRSARTD